MRPGTNTRRLQTRKIVVCSVTPGANIGGSFERFTPQPSKGVKQSVSNVTMLSVHNSREPEPGKG